MIATTKVQPETPGQGRVEEVRASLAAKLEQIREEHDPLVASATVELDNAESAWREAGTKRHRALSRHTGAVLRREEARRQATLAPKGGSK